MFDYAELFAVVSSILLGCVFVQSELSVALTRKLPIQSISQALRGRIGVYTSQGAQLISRLQIAMADSPTCPKPLDITRQCPAVSPLLAKDLFICDNVKVTVTATPIAIFDMVFNPLQHFLQHQPYAHAIIFVAVYGVVMAMIAGWGLGRAQSRVCHPAVTGVASQSTAPAADTPSSVDRTQKDPSLVGASSDLPANTPVITQPAVLSAATVQKPFLPRDAPAEQEFTGLGSTAFDNRRRAFEKKITPSPSNANSAVPSSSRQPASVRRSARLSAPETAAKATCTGAPGSRISDAKEVHGVSQSTVMKDSENLNPQASSSVSQPTATASNDVKGKGRAVEADDGPNDSSINSAPGSSTVASKIPRRGSSLFVHKAPLSDVQEVSEQEMD